MKIKVIDLLNKIANGEKVPRKIKYDGKLYFYCVPCKIYEIDGKDELWGKDLYNMLDNLNDEVEIIEDTPKEKKIPEEIECYHQYDECVVKDKFYQDQKGSLVDEIIIDTINEIIDYLKSKGE